MDERAFSSTKNHVLELFPSSCASDCCLLHYIPGLSAGGRCPEVMGVPQETLLVSKTTGGAEEPEYTEEPALSKDASMVMLLA